ncbi:MAG: hypothetical protein GF383_06650 [Candidatus Lokiarchaeota archaeon]|nr:hypothetical protein [Candidatus Lokiarchaeota archaeon]MBD3339771.1 hypothetical protein [Candidatus Lokiarchaeota archaeon]
MAASQDSLTPKSAMKTMNEQIPNINLKVVKNSGHYLHLSEAPKVN